MGREFNAEAFNLLTDLGGRAYRESQYVDAVRLYEEAQRLAESSGHEMAALYARYFMADSLRVCGRVAEAIPHFGAVLAARERLTSAPWPDLIGHCYAKLVNCLHLQPAADLKRLLEIVDEGLAWSVRYHCHGAQIDLYGQRQEVFSLLGRPDETITAAEQALAMRRRYPDAQGPHFCALTNRMAELLLDRGRSEDWPRIDVLLREALDHESSSVQVQSWSYQVLARLALVQDEPVRAIGHLQEARALSVEAQSPELLLVLKQLADLCLDQGDWHQVEGHLQEGRFVPDPDSLGGDRFGEAQSYLQEAARQVFAMSNILPAVWRFDLLTSLVSLRLAQGQAHRSSGELGAARRRLLQARRACRRLRRYALALDRQQDGGRVAWVGQALARIASALAALDAPATPAPPATAATEEAP